MHRPAARRRLARPARIALRVLSVLFAAILLQAAWTGWHIATTTPRTSGAVALAGLSAPVILERDALGTATLVAATRRDLATALGYAHAQDRFFQMDMLRRVAAGELSALAGGTMADVDRRFRPHRFRARARALLAAMSADERAILEAYAAGVNAGLADLGARPFEHALLWQRPRPWAAEDSILAVFAMYLNLQPALPQRELDRAHAAARLGPAMATFLHPSTSPLDAALDGSRLADPPLPRAIAPLMAGAAPAPPPSAAPPEGTGSNNWAVAGALTGHGAALVANDMHLGLGVPSTWFRARLRLAPPPGSAEAPLDLNGVTLPGTPFLVAGSNGRIAWGFTNSYIDTADAVIIEWVDEAAGLYRVPGGTARVRAVDERLCMRLRCTRLRVRETIWGPIVATDALGRTIAMRWTAHRPGAVRIAPALELERATSVAQAIAVAHRSAIPQQNLVVGDAEGTIGWTIIGRIPRRRGFTGEDAVSLADGGRGWAGELGPDETPAVIAPPSGRIWTANARVIGGNAYALLGDGGYDTGARAGRIRDRLFARNRFTPTDFLDIQLDDRSVRNDWWQALLLAEIARRPDDRALQALRPAVEGWGGRALPQSSGYRIVDRFRRELVDGLYERYVGKPEPGSLRRTRVPPQGEAAIRRLLAERPAALLPPGAQSWEAILDEALARVARDVRRAGGPDRYLWGEVGRAGVTHPLARMLPPLAWAVDPPDRAVPGDRATVRAQARGFGASQRFAVAPGHEAEGIFHMPGGQSGKPAAPWYLAGHEDWLEGRPAPFLPGATRYRVSLVPPG